MLKVNLISHTPNPDNLVASCAKLCYSSVGIDDIQEKLTSQSVEKFLDMLMKLGHGSVLEHVTFSFGVEGVSRITEIQLVRHRVGCSYSIQSGRYVKRDNAEFVTPPNIKKSKVASKVYSNICNASIDAYNELFLILMLQQMGYNDEQIEQLSTDKRINTISDLNNKDKKTYSKLEKIAIEDSRYAHLQSLSTKLVVTMNARALHHFIAHRSCLRSQWEIRNLSNEMLNLVKEVAPFTFKYAGKPCMFGECPEGVMGCGNGNQDKVNN